MDDINQVNQHVNDASESVEDAVESLGYAINAASRINQSLNDEWKEIVGLHAELVKVNALLEKIVPQSVKDMINEQGAIDDEMSARADASSY